MTKKSSKNLSRFVKVLFVSNLAIDGYNSYAHNSENRKLSYASIITAFGVAILDFIVSVRSPKKFTKFFSIISLLTTFASLYKRYKRV